MRKNLIMILFLAVIVPFVGCSKSDGEETAKGDTTGSPAEKAPEPDFITVQHILIGYQGSVPGKPITRTKAEAEALAKEVFERAKKGEDYDALVKEYTDDSAPGVYKIANFNAQADMANKVFPRAQMVPAFGDTGFPLEVGGIGLAEYDPQKSQYGWHIVKRVE